jgi:hypothetical protein
MVRVMRPAAVRRWAVDGREGRMKTFMLVAMLIGLLLTGWLVLRDVQEQSTAGHGAAVIKPIERAEEARRTIEGADKRMEQRIDDAARE